MSRPAEMIKNMIDLLNTNDFYGKSENIDIAKGKFDSIINSFIDLCVSVSKKLSIILICSFIL